MSYRRKCALAMATTAAAAAVAAFAFFSMGTASTAHAEGAHGIQNLSCNVAPMPIQMNTPETLTCTFTFNGSSHTFVADFDVSSTKPFLQVSSCTLDDQAVHFGPCP